MSVVLNRAGYNHALFLIKAGKVDKTSSWSISVDDGNKILGDPPNFNEYKKWHLGHNTEANSETKEAWKYPFGKNGKLYRSALIAIRQRAAQQGATDIFNAAGRLLAAMEGESAHSEETGWIPIFQTGTWTDAQGNTRTWTEKDLDEIVENYDPNWHEAPVVIGHPKEDVPAYGWVEKLKRAGNVLHAKIKDVVPEFKELVNKGAFKKRSIALSKAIKDGVWYLRHIGFLGAVPPAVKGLADIKLAQEVGDSVVEISFSEGGSMDIGKIKEELAASIRKELEARFAEQVKREKEEKEQLAKEKMELERKLKLAEHEKFIGTLMSEGKVTPAMKEAGIVEFMLQLNSETEVEFAEGQKKSPLAFFKDFLSNLPKIVEFKEMAKKDKAGKEQEGNEAEFKEVPGIIDQERLELHKKAVAYQKEHNCTYKEAILAIIK